ncbi:unnamed protein product [Rhizoctonia solani]|uniref:Uncharacterized protein n=1 Tax=Rhizoctonia solani TaxID=456999 RepID=A0A8H3HTB8_9AGAM|nr:unnamed protein product [Rhizoctonia solani]
MHNWTAHGHGLDITDWMQGGRDLLTSDVLTVRARLNLTAIFVASEVVLAHLMQRVVLVNKLIRIAWLSMDVYETYGHALKVFDKRPEVGLPPPPPPPPPERDEDDEPGQAIMSDASVPLQIPQLLLILSSMLHSTTLDLGPNKLSLHVFKAPGHPRCFPNPKRPILPSLLCLHRYPEPLLTPHCLSRPNLAAPAAKFSSAAKPLLFNRLTLPQPPPAPIPWRPAWVLSAGQSQPHVPPLSLSPPLYTQTRASSSPPPNPYKTPNVYYRQPEPNRRSEERGDCFCSPMTHAHSREARRPGAVDCPPPAHTPLPEPV